MHMCGDTSEVVPDLIEVGLDCMESCQPECMDIYGLKKLYGKEVEGVIRSTFVIDEDGTVELAQYNVKATGHVAKLRRDLGLD